MSTLFAKFRNRNFNLQNDKKLENLSFFKDNDLTVNINNPYVRLYLRDL